MVKIQPVSKQWALMATQACGTNMCHKEQFTDWLLFL